MTKVLDCAASLVSFACKGIALCQTLGQYECGF